MNIQFNLTARPGSQEIVITCMINAPRNQVFDAYLDASLIPQWWGPRDLTTKIDRLEKRTGGIWRFVQKDANGEEYAFHGVFHSINKPEKIIQTFEFEGFPGKALLEVITFEEQSGGTKIIDQSIFQCKADRDGMLNSGMEKGASESMERLAELLESIIKDRV